MSAARFLWVVSLCVLVMAGPVNAQSDARVEQPRPFGYTIGDVFSQRVLLEIDGKPFEPAELPQAERAGPWLERRQVRIEERDDGRWLVVDYQLINAPQSLRTIIVPEWWIDAGAGRGLRVPEWPISIAPLTPQAPFGVGALRDLRPDHAVPRVDTASLARDLVVWVAVLLVTLLTWGGWIVWRNWQDSLQKPFARALKRMRGEDPASPKVWEALHAAFDQVAGRVIHADLLPVLFERAPYLRSERDRIEAFFAASSTRFFADQPAEPAFSLPAFCADLRRLEKRHEP